MTDEVQTERLPSENPRNRALAQIADRVEVEKAGDFQDFNEASGEIAARPQTEQPEQAAQQEQVEQAGQTEKPAVAQEQPKKKYTLVVDGESVEVDEDKIIDAGRRTIQKETAVDRRLAEANRLKKEAEALLNQARPPELSKDAPDTPVQAISPETLPTLVQGIEARIISTIDANQAVQKFREEFQDIAKDPELWQLAVFKNQQRIDHSTAVGEPLGSDLDAYRKIGEEIRKRFVPTNTNKVAAELADKAEKKRTITSIPAVNAKDAPAKEGKPQTVSEEIEEMRQLRKQGYRTQGFARLRA